MDENLSELLVKKEKELQEISKLRLIQLEDQLKNRNFTIQELQQKLEKIQEDFQYNLNLIDDRDAELLEIEEKFENIRKILKQKDTEISELRATIASLEQRVKIENNKIKTSEMVLIQSRDQLREELAEVKWKKEDEIRKLLKTLEETEKKFEKLLREKDEEIVLQRINFSQKYEKNTEKILEKNEEEKKNFLAEILEKNEKIESLTKNFFSLKEDLDTKENKTDEIEKFYNSKISALEQAASDKETQISKLIDHTKHLSSQLELFQAQLVSETEYNSTQKSFYEKEINKLRNSSNEEYNFMKESYELQIQRLNSTYTSQITRLQERLSLSEEEAEKNYIQFCQQREKNLQNEKKLGLEADRIEENYKKDIKNNEEIIRIQRLDLNNKENEIRSIQENLGAWKTKCEQYSDEAKKLRIALQEAEIQISSLKIEKNNFQENKNLITESLLMKIKEDYERKIKELTEDLEFAKGKKNAENMNFLKKTDEFPKLWSEDYGPISSFRSNESSHKELFEENKELKRIIEEMRKEMEFISLSAKKNSDDDGLKEIIIRLKNEIVRITAERDQLLDISSDLRAELRFYANNQNYNEKDFMSQSPYIQQDFQKSKDQFFSQKIPKYNEFEEIINQPPEKEEKPEIKKIHPVNSNRETASQKEVSEKIKANLKKTKKNPTRNYNIKE